MRPFRKVASCLVKRGHLRSSGSQTGGPLVASEAMCIPRILLDDSGQQVTSVGPGHVVTVSGWKELPPAGSLVLEVDSTVSCFAAWLIRCIIVVVILVLPASLRPVVMLINYH